REDPRVLPRVGVGVDLRLHEGPDAGAEGGVLVGEAHDRTVVTIPPTNKHACLLFLGSGDTVALMSDTAAAFLDECLDLDALVADLEPDAWSRDTPAAGWSIAHQIAHLAWTD